MDEPPYVYPPDDVVVPPDVEPVDPVESDPVRHVLEEQTVLNGPELPPADRYV